MVWALLAFVGVPLWLCAMGIIALLYRNRALRRRHGDIQVRVLRPGKTRWTRGHAVWVSDVFAWRGSPAAWNEYLEQIADAKLENPTPEELKHLHRLCDHPVVATLKTTASIPMRVATTPEHGPRLLGPFVPSSV